MPVEDCSEGGKPGYRWGSAGACYTFSPGDDAARRKAKQRAYIQGAAVQASQARRGEKPKSTAIDMLIAKTFDTTIQASKEISPELRAKIAKMALEPVPDDQIYVAHATLANDQLDRSYERFRPEHLQRFADTIGGKALLPGHDQSAIPLGRWVEGLVTRDAAGSHQLMATFYVAAKSELATRLRMGIAKDVSIRFKAAGRQCDLCDEPYDGCPHNKGHEYDGKLCTVTYSGDPQRYEALEGSLVWLACQRGAEVVGAKAAGLYGGHVLEMEVPEEKTVTKDEETALLAKVAEQEDEIKRLKAYEARAKDGDAYQAMLKGQIAKNMAAVKGRPHDEKTPDPEITILLKTLEGANTETLQSWDKLWQEQFDQKFPPQPLSRPMGEGEGHSVPAPVGEQAPVKGFDPFASLKKGY
jgi:hypothetical protein